MRAPVIALIALLAVDAAAAQQVEQEELPAPGAPVGETSGEDAAAEATTVPVEMPEDAATLADRAEQRYLEGDLEGAASAYVALAEATADPRRRMDHLLAAAWIEQQLDRPWRVRDLLLRGLGDDPDYPFQPHDYPQAFVDLYEQVLEHVRVERHNRAVELVRSGLAEMEAGRLAEARRLFGAALAVKPGDPFALYDLALLDTREGRAEAAIAGYERLLSLEAGVPGTLPPELLARTRASLGFLYFERGFLDDAARHLEEAVRLEPTNARAWNNLGLVRRRLGDVDGAREALERAAATDPTDVQAAVNLGVTEIQAGRWPEAVGVLEAAARRDPQSFEATLNLGLARRGFGDPASAEIAFDRAAGLATNASQSALAGTYLAVVRYERGDFAGAERAAAAVVEAAPEQVDAWIYLGLARQSLGRLAEARASFERAAALDPTRPEIANNLGTVLVAEGDYPGAAAAFRRALAIEPGFAQAAANLAEIEPRLAVPAAPVGGQPGASSGGTRPPAAAADQPRQAAPIKPLGLELDPIDYNYMGIRGALVAGVRTGGPASRGGLRKGDVILNVDGRPVEGGQGLMRYIQRETTGNEVVLDVLRDGKPKRVRVEIR